MKKYDYLIVGSGLFGATVGYFLRKSGKKVLIIDKRDHIGGNIYTKNENNIDIHVYGAHIFHTTEKEVWDFVNSLDHFIPYNHSVDANNKGEIYSLPFNMYTFEKVFGLKDPDLVVKRIEEEKKAAGITEPKNLEEKAISLVGKTIYELLIKHYTEKQWGRKCTDLPPFIISRLPFRLTYDNNYFNDPYQGMPEHGYTQYEFEKARTFDIVDGKPVVIQRGQYHTSILKLSNRWGWDRKKTSRFLDVLESDQMLSQERTKKGTTLTIVNYDIYQCDGTTIGTTDGTTIGTTDGTQTRKKERKNISTNVDIEDEVLREKVLDWLKYKSERRESYKDTGLKSLITQIKKKQSEYGTQAVVDCINLSMSQGWKGIIWDKIKCEVPCIGV